MSPRTRDVETPAHDWQAETAVIGAGLRAAADGSDAVTRAVAALSPLDFYAESHRTMFAGIRELHEQGRAFDVAILRAHLSELGQEISVDELMACWEQASIPGLVDDYCASIKRHAAAREGEAALMRAMQSLRDKVPLATVQQALSDELALITEHGAGEAIAKVKGPQAVGEVVAAIESGLDEPETDFVPTPIPELNMRLGGGLLPGEQLICGGRPGTAKTSLWLQGGVLAAEHGHRVLIVSREMKNAALGRRILAQQAGVGATALRRRNVDDDGRRRIKRALPRLAALPLWLDDSSRTMPQIRRWIRRLKPRLVIVDYLQLVRGPEGSKDRRLEVTAISSGLKACAMEFNCSTVVLSSLRRLLMDKGKRVPPTMEDLKESGDIEADADVIVLLWQPNKDTTDREVIFEKTREGEAGGPSTTLAFSPFYVRFDEVPAGPPPSTEALPDWVTGKDD